MNEIAGPYDKANNSDEEDGILDSKEKTSEGLIGDDEGSDGHGDEDDADDGNSKCCCDSKHFGSFRCHSNILRTDDER